MTADYDITGLGWLRTESEKAFRDEKSDHAADVEELREWKDRALAAEQERDELGRLLADSEVRRRELEGMYAREVAAAATARAQAEALKGNR